MENSPLPASQELPPGIERLETGAAVKFMQAPGEGPLPAVVVVHGWKSPIFKAGGSYERNMQLLNADGYHVLGVSLRGHELAEGKIEEVTRAQHKEDIIAAFEYLKKRPEVDLTKIGAFGVSYGGYMLSTLSSQLPLKQLALRAPALYFDKNWDSPSLAEISDNRDALKEWRETTHAPDESLAYKGLHGFNGDLLIVSGQYDEDMPPAIMRGYMQAASLAKSKELVEIAGARHALFGEHAKQFSETLGKWFKEHYPAA